MTGFLRRRNEMPGAFSRFADPLTAALLLPPHRRTLQPVDKLGREALRYGTERVLATDTGPAAQGRIARRIAVTSDESPPTVQSTFW